MLLKSSFVLNKHFAVQNIFEMKSPSESIIHGGWWVAINWILSNQWCPYQSFIR